MGIVEWTRLDGGQVEAVIAMFVNRERPNSVRITPSRGDGGVDILDRGAGPDGSDVVYQVKRYTDKLTAKQKADIEDSLKRLTTDKRWGDLSVSEWRLVTPWDPSPEAEKWLQDLGYPTMRKIWHGLTWADQQAAKYDDVVDYYLHGGRALVEKAHAEVMTYLGAQNATDHLSVPDVQRQFQDALRVLDHDPHYRYEHRFGEGPPPPYPRDGDRPGLVMHTQEIDAAASRWSTVDIIARCAASTEVRPITIKGTFVAEPDSELAQDLADFFTYGAPFSSPAGAFKGILNAPGGLGGPLEQATVWAGPTPEGDLGQNPDLHLEVLDTGGASLTGVDVRRVERSQGVGGGGLRVVFEEVNGLFTMEDRYDLSNARGSRTVRFGDWHGKPVRAAHNGLLFLSELRTPNRLRFSVRHTAPSRGVENADIGFNWGEDLAGALGAATRILATLTTLQDHAATPILTPEISEVTREQLRNWQRAVDVLSGKEVVATYPEGQCLVVRLENEVAIVEGEDLRLVLPLWVKVEEQVVDLGHHEVVLASPTVVERRTDGDGVLHAFTVDDRTVRWRRQDPTDAGGSVSGVP